MIHIDTVPQPDGIYSRASLLKRASHPRATWETAVAGRWMRSEGKALKSLMHAVIESDDESLCHFFTSTRFRYKEHLSPPDDFDPGDPQKRHKPAE